MRTLETTRRPPRLVAATLLVLLAAVGCGAGTARGQSPGAGEVKASGIVAPIKRVRPAAAAGGGRSGRAAKKGALPQCAAGEVLVRKSGRCEPRSKAAKTAAKR